MNDQSAMEVTRRWLTVLADADYEAWSAVAAGDLVIRTPFAPPGLPKICEGRDVCLAMARKYGTMINKFTYFDVELHTTDDPELIMGTARSEALTASGGRYANQYCIVSRVKAGRVADYAEYFDPLQIIAAADPGAGTL
jgi:uncharacterized protein